MLLLDDSGCSGLYDVVRRCAWCARPCARDLIHPPRAFSFLGIWVGSGSR
jgi:hypothetical protein